MDVEITGRHIVITPAIRAYVMKRLRKFDKFFGADASFHVIIDVEKERHTAEILLKSKLLNLTGKGETGDMYSSIVRAVEKLERQAIKNKSRLIETKRQKAKAHSVAEKSGVSVSRVRARPLRRPAREEETPSGATTVQEEDMPPTAMAVEDAVTELERSEYPFVVFRNLASGSVNILYRRKDGLLGLIQE
jgi:putative sigma-54 modulation protein